MIDTSRQERALEKDYSKSLSKDIFKTSILVVGCGGIGSILAELLIRGGFSTLDIVDFDVVDKTNIQRQNYTQNDIEIPKVQALKKRLLTINPEATINIYPEQFKSDMELNSYYSMIFDCTDNIETRKEIHSFASKREIPWTYSGAIQSQSVCYIVENPKLFVFEKIFPNNSKNQGCEDGVLASTTFISASLVYNQFLKFLLGLYNNKLIKYDASKGIYIEVDM